MFESVPKMTARKKRFIELKDYLLSREYIHEIVDAGIENASVISKKCGSKTLSAQVLMFLRASMGIRQP